MFGLTFAIYGGMTLVSLLVFLVEVLVGKPSKREEATTEDKNAVSPLEENVDDIKVVAIEEDIATVQVHESNDYLEIIESIKIKMSQTS